MVMGKDHSASVMLQYQLYYFTRVNRCRSIDSAVKQLTELDKPVLVKASLRAYFLATSVAAALSKISSAATDHLTTSAGVGFGVMVYLLKGIYLLMLIGDIGLRFFQLAAGACKLKNTHQAHGLD
jgi:hypothetical protein